MQQTIPWYVQHIGLMLCIAQRVYKYQLKFIHTCSTFIWNKDICYNLYLLIIIFIMKLIYIDLEIYHLIRLIVFQIDCKIGYVQQTKSPNDNGIST